MPVTFNANNNYSVDIISESDVSNPSSVKYTSISNTPFVEIKITPTNPQTNPVLASNLKIDNIISEFVWNAGVNYNSKGICEPPPPPHNANSSLQHLTGIGVTTYCQNTFGINGFNGNSNLPQQGPYIALLDFTTQTSQIAANGVSWSQILLIEVYEGDQGGLINDDHSPEIDEQFNHWAMWSGPVMTQNGLRGQITTNIYPKYVKAFVYLSFGNNGLTGLTADTTLNLDIDEVEPTYGCTDPLANNTTLGVTVDDGSCDYGPPEYSIYAVDIGNTNIIGNYSSLFPSAVPSHDGINQTTMDLSALNRMPKVFQVGNAPTPGTIILANTYLPGTLVEELVEINLLPRSQVIGTDNFLNDGTQIMETSIAAYDFPVVGGGPNDPAQDVTNNFNFFGDALNNLTASSINIRNIDPDQNTELGRPVYVASGTSGIYSSLHSTPIVSSTPQWMPDSGILDEDGLFPTTLVEWHLTGDYISCNQSDGSVYDVEIEGIWAEEIYTGNQTMMNSYPGLEWYPRKVKLYVKLSFLMPAHNVEITLDLRHDNNYLAQA